MSKEFDLGKIVREGFSIKLWGIVSPERILEELDMAEVDPREKTAILKGWADIQAFTDQGGVMTSSGILIPQGTSDSLSVRKGTKIFEIGTDFAGSLGFVRTVGKSVNLNSTRYPVYEIKRGFGKFMHGEYREFGIDNTYSIDPDAIAQQALLNLALTRGRGDVTQPPARL